jgi:hypothetical protein
MNEELIQKGPADGNGSDQDVRTDRQKRGAKMARTFWARFPTPEARSQYMKERFAKVKARQAKDKKRRSKPEGFKTAEDEGARHALYELRILVGDVSAMLDSCCLDNRGAKDLFGGDKSRTCYDAATSILKRGIGLISEAFMYGK